jgi:two-component system response regulator LytT
LERLTRDILTDSVSDVTCIERLGDSRRFLDRNDIDLLLLDLNLNGEDGFDLLKQATAARFQTVVVSANTDQALRAFEYGVLDFVPKPVERERLERALRRVGGEHVAHMPGAPSAKYLSVRRLGALYLIPVEQVSYLKGAGDYVEIHLRDGRAELHSKSLEALEQILPERFVRVHKSYIADLSDVKRVLVHGGGRYELEVTPETRIPLSRTRYKELQALLGGREGRDTKGAG